ncbi:MAG: MrpF/PhaF family protein [Lachnospiraceae bacterium]|nr:MrpF/PhaF family protein [Lachnospiraceae bacterium]
MTKNKMKRKHRDNSIVSLTVLITTTIAFIALSSIENINTIALILACIAFLGTVFNTLYVWASDYEEEKQSRHGRKN